MRQEPFDDRADLPLPVSPGQARGVPLAPSTVLLADDDDSSRRALRSVLEDEGYGVLETSTGVETLELLASAADGHAPIPDVLVLDVCMPGYSGLGVLAVMRRFSERPRVIVVTGLRDPSVETFAKRLGAVRVLHKPIDLDELLAEVLANAKAPSHV